MVRDNNIRIRIFKNRLLYVLVCVLSGLTAIPLLAILGEVLIKGWKQLGWSFITEATPNAYKAMQAVSAGAGYSGWYCQWNCGYFPDVDACCRSCYTSGCVLWNLFV